MVESTNPILLAFLAGIVGGPLGGLGAAIVGVTVLGRVAQSIRGAVLAFAGGFILAVAFLELIARALETSEGWVTALVPIGLVIGIAIRALMVKFVAGSDPSNGDAAQYRRGQASKLSATLTAENLLEGLTIGVAFDADLALGVLIAALMTLDTFAEGLSVSSELAEGEHEAGTIFWLTIAPTPLLGVGAALGAFLGGLSPLMLAALFGAGAGIMLHAVFDDIVADAHALGSGPIVSLPLLVGITLAIVVAELV